MAPANGRPGGLTHIGLYSDDAQASVTQFRQAGAMVGDVRPSENSGSRLSNVTDPRCNPDRNQRAACWIADEKGDGRVEVAMEASMKKTVVTLVAVVAGLLIASRPVAAHHGAQRSRTTRPSASCLKGTVTEWIWANPHTFLQFDVKGDDGQVVHWVVEASNPPDMQNRGWTNKSFKAGDEGHGDGAPRQERQAGREHHPGSVRGRSRVERGEWKPGAPAAP
jgi:hypothetical protein